MTRNIPPKDGLERRADSQALGLEHPDTRREKQPVPTDEIRQGHFPAGAPRHWSPRPGRASTRAAHLHSVQVLPPKRIHVSCIEKGCREVLSWWDPNPKGGGITEEATRRTKRCPLKRKKGSTGPQAVSPRHQLYQHGRQRAQAPAGSQQASL